MSRMFAPSRRGVRPAVTGGPGALSVWPALRGARAARLVLPPLALGHLTSRRRRPPALLLAEENRDRRGDEDRRVGAADDADEHREREAAQRLAAEDIQGEHREERRAGGDDRPRQRLIDAEIHHLLERLAAHRPQVLADAVEDDDRVVHRIAGNRQQRGNDVQRQVVPGERQEGERDENVVQGRGNGADRERETEPEADVDRDCENRRDRRVNSATLQVGADHWADQLTLDDGGVQAGGLQRLLDLQRLALQAALGFIALDLRQADEHLLFRRIVVLLDHFLAGQRVERAANVGFVGALHQDRRATGEVDAERQTARRHHDGARGDDDERQDNGVPPPADEVEIGVREDLHKSGLNTQRLRLAAARQDHLEHRPRHEHRREDVGEKTDGQRGGKPADGAGTELEEKRRRNQRRDVGIDDRPPDAVEPGVYRGARSARGSQLLLDPLENQHVRVDAHTNRQDEAG